MDKKDINWSQLGFGYQPTEARYVSNYKDGAWDEGGLTDNPNITLNECAGVFQYAQTVFEGLKAYTTEDGHIASHAKRVIKIFDGRISEDREDAPGRNMEGEVAGDQLR